MQRSPNHIILDEHDLKEAVSYFAEQDAFVFDVETVGPLRGVPTKNDVLWIALATHGETIVVPLGHPNGDTMISRATKKLNPVTRKFAPIPAVFSEPPKQLPPSVAFGIMEPLFFSENIIKVAHNAPFDIISVAKYYDGDLPFAPFADTIVMSWMLDENRKTNKLGVLVKDIYGFDYKEDIGKKVEAHEFWKVARYAYFDARNEWLLYQRMLPMLMEDGLESTYRLEMDVLEVICSMENVGAPIDMEAIRALKVSLGKRIEGLEAKVYKAAGREFNINSSPQKAELFYSPKSAGGLGLKTPILTGSGKKAKETGQQLLPQHYSTGEEALETLLGTPVVDALLEYQESNRLQSGYITAYLGDEEQGKDSIIYGGRLIPEFLQYGTVSGRFSCRQPNLQNVPGAGTDLGKQVRGLFIAPPDCKLVVADWAQMELRILAHYAGQGRLWDGFMDDIDAHTATAAALFNIPPEKVEKWQRSVAKAIAFAIVYGAGPPKVASMAKISVKDAKKFLALHQQLFPEIYIFRERMLSECRKRTPPHLRTMLGRYRRLPYLNSRNMSYRSRAERQAMNSLVQGGNADLMKLSMIRAHRTLPVEMKLILTVHDELVTIVPKDRAEEGAEIIREAMEGPGIARFCRIPLKADVKIVDRWSDAK